MENEKNMRVFYTKCLELAMEEDLNYKNVSDRFIKIVEASSIHKELTQESCIQYETAEGSRLATSHESP